MLRPALSLMVLATVFGTTVASAQTSGADTGPSIRGEPVAGYSTVHSLHGDWQRVDFYVVVDREVRLPNGLPWISHVARRVSGASADDPGVVTWARSETCPALHNSLVWMTNLISPRIEISGITPRTVGAEGVDGVRPTRMIADGQQVTIWGRGAQPDNTVFSRVEMSSNGGMIADFAKAATENMAECWTGEAPADMSTSKP